MDCSQPATFALIAPDDAHTRTEFNFTCGADNYGVFRQQMTELAAVGRWVYNVRPGDAYDSLSVTVTGKARETDGAGADPIRTRCWVSTGGQALNSGVSLKLAVMAEVMQGNKPVIGAEVSALVERPPESPTDEPIPPMEITLLDNGSGTEYIY